MKKTKKVYLSKNKRLLEEKLDDKIIDLEKSIELILNKNKKSKNDSSL